jgi:hypothetical protein
LATTPSRFVGDVRSRWLLYALAVICGVVFTVVLRLTDYKNFYYDEWDFITQNRTWDLKALFLPHNEHWSTIPILVWKLLFALVGLRTHIPYEGALLATHVTAVLLMFVLVRRHSGDLPAFAAALTLLVLGSGATDITWAFQLTWVASVAFGLAAILLLDGNPAFPGRMIAASAALLCSLMCSGVGLAFLVAIGAELVVDRRRWRFLLAVVVPVIAFGVWFVFFGAGLAGTPGAPCPTCSPTGFRADVHRGPIGLSYLLTLATFVKSGLDGAAAGIFGSGTPWPPLIIVIAALVGIHWYRKRTIPSIQVGLAAGAIAWFAIVGLGRVQHGTGYATDSHYVYVGVVLLLPIVADVASELPWRGVWRPLLTAAFALALVGNVTLLHDQTGGQVDLMKTENAELQTVAAFRGAPDMAMQKSLDDTIMPQLSPGPYFAAVDDLGSPVPNATVDSLHQLSDKAVDGEMVNLFGDALTVAPDSSRTTEGLQCQNIDPSKGSTMDFQVPDGQWLVLEPNNNGDAYLSIGFISAPPSKPLRQAHLTAGTPVWVHLPDTGKQIDWRLRVQVIDANVGRVCGTTALRVGQTPNNSFSANAESFTLGTGWSSVVDVSASGGHAAKAASGSRPAGGAFGVEFLPTPGAYDIWYRMKVSSNSGTAPQLLLTLTDATAQAYIVSTAFSPSQANTRYDWILVASHVTPTKGHLMRFQMNISGNLTTDWYFDEAVMVPAGSPTPSTASS